jgi:prephenate dehydrogenase
MTHAAVIGTGLIGASMGMALRSQGHRVVGWDPNPDEASEALVRGAIDSIAASRDDAVDDADLIVLAAPPAAIVAHLADLPVTNVLTLDVAGVKGPIVEAASRLERFVGTHPMAGREHGGAAHASPTLFRGATWIVVPDGASDDDLATVTALLEATGANVVTMDAAAHDDAVAAISHLPQSLAVQLVAHAADDPVRLDLAAGSFRDLTRVALSDERMWVELLQANGAVVADHLRRLGARLADFADVVEAGDADAVGTALRDARTVRQTMAPPVVAIRIIIEDRPGELARVGAALADTRVDVRDLQLRHGRHGGGGVLTISVRPGEAEPLRDALRDQGFELG